MYVSRPSREALDEQMQELDSRISKEEKHRDAQDEKPHDKHEEQRRAKITVTVAAETEGKAKLLLSYGRFTFTCGFELASYICIHSRFECKLDSNLRCRRFHLTLGKNLINYHTTLPSLHHAADRRESARGCTHALYSLSRTLHCHAYPVNLAYRLSPETGTMVTLRLVYPL